MSLNVSGTTPNELLKVKVSTTIVEDFIAYHRQTVVLLQKQSVLFLWRMIEFSGPTEEILH